MQGHLNTTRCSSSVVSAVWCHTDTRLQGSSPDSSVTLRQVNFVSMPLIIQNANSKRLTWKPDQSSTLIKIKRINKLTQWHLQTELSLPVNEKSFSDYKCFLFCIVFILVFICFYLTLLSFSQLLKLLEKQRGVWFSILAVRQLQSPIPLVI